MRQDVAISSVSSEDFPNGFQQSTYVSSYLARDRGLILNARETYAAMTNALKKHRGNVDVKVTEEILSCLSGCVCSHQQDIKLGTIWSVVATLKEPRIFLAEGHQCKTGFREDVHLKKTIQR